MVGGTAGFMGALVIRPRHGKEKDAATRGDVTEDPAYETLVNKFGDRAAVEAWIAEEADDTEFEPNSIPFVVYGTIILFFGLGIVALLQWWLDYRYIRQKSSRHLEDNHEYNYIWSSRRNYRYIYKTMDHGIIL